MELRGSDEVFAMKAMDKSVMLNRNKVFLTYLNLFYHDVYVCLQAQESVIILGHQFYSNQRILVLSQNVVAKVVVAKSSSKVIIINDSLFWPLVFSKQHTIIWMWILSCFTGASSKSREGYFSPHGPSFSAYIVLLLPGISSELPTSHMTLIHCYL